VESRARSGERSRGVERKGILGVDVLEGENAGRQAGRKRERMQTRDPRLACSASTFSRCTHLRVGMGVESGFKIQYLHGDKQHTQPTCVCT
jgi:hypothetical protein